MRRPSHRGVRSVRDMYSSAHLGASLLLSGLVTGVVLVVQMIAVRHLPLDSVPGVLQGRIALSNRLRPWLIAAAGGVVASGLVLQLR
jgi:hypothetical protein